ncbi:craniofacial development protein 2-like [Sycon ciliatum]|uniref:craniofacial development protein 2-like n=1 Tax=Sycon ciliatum TaxID=27933 RepID=UPI0031F647AC
MARRPTDRERHTPAQSSERGTAKTVGSGKFKKYSSNLNIATFNVLGLKSSLKRTTLTRDLARCAVDVCSLQETKLTDGLDESILGHRLICFPTKNYHYGLGFAVSSRLEIHRYWAVSDRVAVLTLSSSPSALVSVHQGQNVASGRPFLAIINAYAPTSTRCASNVAEMDRFYDDLATAYSEVSSSALLYICGDFNAKVGSGRRNANCLGSHGRGRRNFTGDTLVNFCETSHLYLANTTFKHPARNITTWTGWRRDKAADQKVPVYNQIDYIICRESQKRLLKNCRSYGGMEPYSDHRIVIANLEIPRVYGVLGSQTRKRSISRQPSVNTLRLASEKEVQLAYAKKLSDSLAEPTGEAGDDVQENWNAIQKHIHSAAATTVGYAKRKKNQKYDDAELEALSKEQRQLRIQLTFVTDDKKRKSLKTKRNRIQHS